MAGNGDIMDGIEPCRTCGIFYLTASNFLRKMFDGPNEELNLTSIRTELSAWSIEINQDDGLPQYICTCCILEFQKLFKFRELCVELQAQWRHFYQIREENKVYIKKELPDPDEKNVENNCDFIYVDDLSGDEEYAGNENGGRNFTPFNFSHIPIKEEIPDNNEAITNVALIPPATETFTTTSCLLENVIEANEGTNNSNELSQMNNSDLNLLDTSNQEQLLDEQFNDSNSLPQSNQDDHDLTTIECNLCLHISANADEHRQHLQRIHDIKDMDCHICGKQFKSSTITRLKYHLKWHRISKHIKCAQCGFFCDSRDTLKEHVRAMHSKIECKTCGKRVLGKKMKVHMRTHEERQWPCSYCNDVFTTENSLESHIWDIHAQEEIQPIAVGSEDKNYLPTKQELEPLSCNLCDQLYPNQHELNAHKLESHLMQNVAETETSETAAAAAEPESQTDQFNYQDTTDMMDISVANLENINENVENVVEDSDAMQLQEQQQKQEPNSFSPKNNNVFTQVISSDEEGGAKNKNLEVYPCPKCTQKFATTSDLCLHFQDHVDKSQFGCHICGKTFKIKFSLNRHLKRHK